MPLPSTSLGSKLLADWPPERWRDVTVLIAVSGGADSVALARAMHELRGGGDGRLILAHFNHGMRGQHSGADQQFVEELASQLGLPMVIGSAKSDLAGSGSGQGIEGAARQARYDFLTEAAFQTGARYVATAHTADDQVETVLFNILRGTGLTGLAGIPRIRRLTDDLALIRPLLSVTRAEVLDYLAAIGQSYRDDSTNLQTHYTRNRLRNELLPLLEREYNPRVREALLRLSKLAAEADADIDHQASQVLGQVARRIPHGIELAVAPLFDESRFLARSVLMAAWRDQGWPLQGMSFEKWDQLAQLAQGAAEEQGQGCLVLPGAVRAERIGGRLQLTRLPTAGAIHSTGAS